MSTIETMPIPHAEPASDTFCVYLARQLIIQRGFSPDIVPPLGALTAQSDFVLGLVDGMSMTVIALIDREAHPGKTFALSPDELEAIGKECLKHSGHMDREQLRLKIQLMEIGPGSADQTDRLRAIRRKSMFSKIGMSAWAIDTNAGAVWTTASFPERSTRLFIQRLLNEPRQAEIVPVAIAPYGFPWLTAAIICLLVAIFAAEIKFGIGDAEKDLKPKIFTLFAFGGLSRSLVLNGGEWYRLLSAPFIHVDIPHLVTNAISLGLAGYILESLIGRAWFAALYVVSAIGGSLLSLTLIPNDIVSVGASGAIMGLFAAMLILSTHFPAGDKRTGLRLYALYTLIPSLLPLASVLKGIRIDYAAHFGGAIAGALVALVMLALWHRSAFRPQFQTAALIVAIAGGAGFAYAAVPVRYNYPVYELNAALAPPDQIPTTDAGAQYQSARLVEKYPRDPRLRFLYAGVLMKAWDFAGAEHELRAGLAEEPLWRKLFPSDLAARMHTNLAMVLVANRRLDEAKQVAKPVCETLTSGPLRVVLDQQKLCDG